MLVGKAWYIDCDNVVVISLMSRYGLMAMLVSNSGKYLIVGSH